MKIEPKIDEIIEFDGKHHQCIRATCGEGCFDCSLRRKNCKDIACNYFDRKDEAQVIFVEAKKMTQEELDKIEGLNELTESVFCSKLKEIDMPDKSKRKVKSLFATLQSFVIKTLKEEVAIELDFPETVDKLLKDLDAMEEKFKKEEEKCQEAVEDAITEAKRNE